MGELGIQLGFLVGTIILLMVSIAWIDSVSLLMKRYPIFQDPLAEQLFYTLIVTVLAVAILLIFKPFGSDPDQAPKQDKRAVDDSRELLFRDIRAF